MKLILFKKLFLFFIFFLIAIFLFFYQKRLQWRNNDNFHLLILLDKVYLYVFQPGQSSLNIFAFPSNLTLDTAKDYGEYQIVKIIPLAQMEKIDPGLLLSLSAEKNLLLPIDGYFYFPKIRNNFSEGVEMKLQNGNLWFLFPAFIFKRGVSNLTFWDLFNLSRFISKLNYTQIYYFDALDSGFLKEEKMPDGSVKIKINEEIINNIAMKYFYNEKFIEENLKASVLNASDYSGAAKKLSQMLSNLGVEIIISRDDQEEREESLIVVQNEKLTESYTIKKIKKILKIKKIIVDKSLKEDFQIIIGKDYINYFYKK